MQFNSILVSSLLALAAIAAPAPETQGAEVKTKRCSWNDGHGDIDCGYFSVVFGDGSLFGNSGSITIKGNDFTTSGGLNCGGDQWKSFSSKLPYTVDIHGGNACDTTLKQYGYDNTWIKYATQYLDTPSDSRCGRVGTLDKGMRCIIARNP